LFSNTKWLLIAVDLVLRTCSLRNLRLFFCGSNCIIYNVPFTLPCATLKGNQAFASKRGWSWLYYYQIERNSPISFIYETIR
jgi:hypothetical protein